jgi:hypothetical protein
LAHNLATPCIGHEPRAKVATNNPLEVQVTVILFKVPTEMGTLSYTPNNIESQKCIISPSHHKCHNPTTFETFYLFIIFFKCSLFYIIFFNPHKKEGNGAMKLRSLLLKELIGL